MAPLVSDLLIAAWITVRSRSIVVLTLPLTSPLSCRRRTTRRIVGAGVGLSGVGTLVVTLPGGQVTRLEPFHASRPMSNVHHPSNVLLLCMVLTLAVNMQAMLNEHLFLVIFLVERPWLG